MHEEFVGHLLDKGYCNVHIINPSHSMHGSFDDEDWLATAVCQKGDQWYQVSLHRWEYLRPYKKINEGTKIDKNPVLLSDADAKSLIQNESATRLDTPEYRQKYEDRRRRDEERRNRESAWQEYLGENSPACPGCDSKMVLRHNGESGEPFWGCSRYSNCRETRSLDPDFHAKYVDYKNGR